MSKYKVSEPSALKFLKANGAVVNENGNVISNPTDYWKKVYEQAEPKVAKYLHADGTIDENPGSSSGANLEDNKEISITENGTVEITPTAGKDGMRKVTATVNVSGGGGTVVYRAYRYGQQVYYLNAGNVLTRFEPLTPNESAEIGPYNYTYDLNTDMLTVGGTVFNRYVSLDLKQ